MSMFSHPIPGTPAAGVNPLAATPSAPPATVTPVGDPLELDLAAMGAELEQTIKQHEDRMRAQAERRPLFGLSSSV